MDYFDPIEKETGVGVHGREYCLPNFMSLVEDTIRDAGKVKKPVRNSLRKRAIDDAIVVRIKVRVFFAFNPD